MRLAAGAAPAGDWLVSGTAQHAEATRSGRELTLSNGLIERSPHGYRAVQELIG